jgi:hypothetical protein
MGRPESLAQVVGPQSPLLGQPCPICRQPFEVGEVISVALYPGRPDLAIDVHTMCLAQARLVE